MSSTNRGGERVADDYYSTPRWATRAIVPYLRLGRDGLILEPSAGDGAILRELIALGVPLWRLAACELRAGGWADCKAIGIATHFGDFLVDHVVGPGRVCPLAPALVVGNPPYSLAMEFVQRSLDVVAPGGTVAMLLRLGFLASQKRAAWHRAHPCDLYVLPKRPSFTPDGKTDSADYGWFVFERGRIEPGIVTVLEVEPGAANARSAV